MRRLSGVNVSAISGALKALRRLRRRWAGYRLGFYPRQQGFLLF